MTRRPIPRPASRRGADDASGRQPSPLRRLPVPDPQPPFDDDQGLSAPGRQPTDAVQGTLALAFPLASGLPAVPSVPTVATGGSAVQPAAPGERRLRLVANTGRTDEAGSGGPELEPVRQSRLPDDDFGPQPTPRTLLPPPRPWAARLVQAITEVGAGARPVSQLVRWTTTEVYDALRHRTAAPARRTPRTAPVNAQVRSVHVSEPDDGVAEVCAIVAHGARCRMVALRLEGVDGRWQCTALQFG